MCLRSKWYEYDLCTKDILNMHKNPTTTHAPWSIRSVASFLMSDYVLQMSQFCRSTLMIYYETGLKNWERDDQCLWKAKYIWATYCPMLDYGPLLECTWWTDACSFIEVKVIIILWRGVPIYNTRWNPHFDMINTPTNL